MAQPVALGRAPRPREPLRERYADLMPTEQRASWGLLQATIKPKLNDHLVNSGLLPLELGVYAHFWYLTDGLGLPAPTFVRFDYDTLYLGLAQFPKEANTVSASDLSHNSTASLVDAVYSNTGAYYRGRRLCIPDKDDFKKFWGRPYGQWRQVTDAQLGARLAEAGICHATVTAAFRAWRAAHLEFRMAMAADVANCPPRVMRLLKPVVDDFLKTRRVVGADTPTSEYIRREYAYGLSSSSEDQDQGPRSVLRRISSSSEEEQEPEQEPCSSYYIDMQVTVHSRYGGPEDATTQCEEARIPYFTAAHAAREDALEVARLSVMLGAHARRYLDACVATGITVTDLFRGRRALEALLAAAGVREPRHIRDITRRFTEAARAADELRAAEEDAMDADSPPPPSIGNYVYMGSATRARVVE